MGLCLGKVGHHSCHIKSLESFHLSAGSWSADQPFGHTSNHRAASQAPAPTSSCYRCSGWRKLGAKVSGMFEMQALICRSSLLTAWREKRAEVVQIQFLEAPRL